MRERSEVYIRDESTVLLERTETSNGLQNIYDNIKTSEDAGPEISSVRPGGRNMQLVSRSTEVAGKAAQFFLVVNVPEGPGSPKKSESLTLNVQ